MHFGCESRSGLAVCCLLVLQLHPTRDELVTRHKEDIVGVEQFRLHVFVESELYIAGISGRADYFGLAKLHNRYIDFELRRRNRQPVALGGLIACFLEPHLPHSLRYEPLVIALFVGIKRVLLVVLGRVPHMLMFHHLAEDVLCGLFVIDGRFDAFDAVIADGLIDESGGVVGHQCIGVKPFARLYRLAGYLHMGRELAGHRILHVCQLLDHFVLLVRYLLHHILIGVFVTGLDHVRGLVENLPAGIVEFILHRIVCQLRLILPVLFFLLGHYRSAACSCAVRKGRTGGLGE